MGIRQWNIPALERNHVTQLMQETGQPELICRILAGRGMQTAEEIMQFIHGSAVQEDPYVLADMDKAVQRIRQALEDDERICVYGDYDCDGLTATALLTSYLQSVGADVIYYIPDREREGYGLNIPAIDLLSRQGVSLIVTVDNGISGHPEILYAREQHQMDVVVTDHHTPRETLPPAVAVVNPHRADCPSMEKDLAGVGVAFKLACALEDAQSEELFEYYADLVALGTIADVVPLTGENREIVRRGLAQIGDTDKIGLKELVHVSGLSEQALSSESLAFGVIPRINAAGRIGTADDVVELLLTESAEEAQMLAEGLDALNAQRKAIEAEILVQIEQKLREQPQILSQRILLLSGEGWCQGVIGIVASKLTDRYEKPCIIFTINDGEARGSGRSVEGFSLIGAIAACSSLLTRYGGHALAAGLTLPAQSLEGFSQQLLDYAGKYFPIMPLPALAADATLAPAELTLSRIESLAGLEPHGAANELPLFHLADLILESIHPTNDGKHIRLRLSGQGNVFCAVYFGMCAQAFPYAPGQRMDLMARVRVNEYRGKQQLTVRVVDIRPSGLPQQDALLDWAYYMAMERGEDLSGEAAARLFPDRDDISLVYRYLRKAGRFAFDADALYSRLFPAGIAYGRMRVAVDVLMEMGLLQNQDGAYVVVQDAPKVDLNTSAILCRLARCKAEMMVSASE